MVGGAWFFGGTALKMPGKETVMFGSKTRFPVVLALICLATPSLAQNQATSASLATDQSATMALNAARSDRPRTVTVRGKRRHGVMHFLFGPNRRRGGFFANLFHRHPRNWWKTSTYRKQCAKRYRSYDSTTNRYRAYSGVRRVCNL